MDTLTTIQNRITEYHDTVTNFGEEHSLLTSKNTTRKESVGTLKMKVNTMFQKIISIENRLEKVEKKGTKKYANANFNRGTTSVDTQDQGFTRNPKYCSTCGVNLWRYSNFFLSELQIISLKQ